MIRQVVDILPPLQHGFARNLDWAIVSTSADANPDDPEPMLELLLTDNEYTQKMWPYEFAAVYQVCTPSSQAYLK